MIDWNRFQYEYKQMHGVTTKPEISEAYRRQKIMANAAPKLSPRAVPKMSPRATTAPIARPSPRVAYKNVDESMVLARPSPRVAYKNVDESMMLARPSPRASPRVAYKNVNEPMVLARPSPRPSPRLAKASPKPSPKPKHMDIVMYSIKKCPFCIKAKQLLSDRGLTFKEIDVEKSPDRKAEMIKRSGRKTVPQIFINGVHVGGYTDLVEYEF
jgi:glutaredoxin 3